MRKLKRLIETGDSYCTFGKLNLPQYTTIPCKLVATRLNELCKTGVDVRVKFEYLGKRYSMWLDSEFIKY